MANQQSEKPQMVPPNPHPPKGQLPNLYPWATVAEGAPVRYSEEQAKAEQKKTPAFHNPHSIKRPQPKGKAAKKRPIARAVMSSSSSGAVPAAIGQQPSLDYWRSTADDDAATLDYKRQMDRQQREKKKQEKKFNKQYGWWKGDAQYRADKPSNLIAYRANGGYRRKLRDFKNFLRARAGASQPSRSRLGSDDFVPKRQFAPPASYDQDKPPTQPAAVPPPEPPTEPRNIPSPPPPYAAAPPPPPPGAFDAASPPPPPPPPAPVPYNPTVSAPPVRYNHVFEGAPVRYQPQPDINEQIPDPDRERPAKRQKMTVAEAMMAKMGHKKGEGLGKNSDGITTHLEVKARRKNGGAPRVENSDSYDDDMSRIVKSQQVFDIFGGHTTKVKEPDRFGDASKVVVAWGCVDGIDWAADADRNDGGIRQEMGQTFDNKFGRIERIFVDQSSASKPVYIKFASELSALNAVNRFSEGYQFRDRNIRALYYSEAKFEASIFEH